MDVKEMTMKLFRASYEDSAQWVLSRGPVFYTEAAATAIRKICAIGETLVAALDGYAHYLTTWCAMQSDMERLQDLGEFSDEHRLAFEEATEELQRYAAQLRNVSDATTEDGLPNLHEVVEELRRNFPTGFTERPTN